MTGSPALETTVVYKTAGQPAVVNPRLGVKELITFMLRRNTHICTKLHQFLMIIFFHFRADTHRHGTTKRNICLAGHGWRANNPLQQQSGVVFLITGATCYWRQCCMLLCCWTQSVDPRLREAQVLFATMDSCSSICFEHSLSFPGNPQVNLPTCPQSRDLHTDCLWQLRAQ